MSQQLDQVSQAALALTPDERAELAERIWESVTAEEHASIERAWCEEVALDRLPGTRGLRACDRGHAP